MVAGRSTSKSSPSPAILALLAAIAPPAAASPLALSFLYPKQKPRRTRPSRRWSAAAQEQAADIANRYTQGPHGNFHSSCWELHGQTNCPRDGDDLSDTLNVDPGAAVSNPIIDNTPSPTSSAEPTQTSATSFTTTSTYTLDFDVKNIPEGWNSGPRSKLYSKPFILGFSVSLAVIILITIIACVIWKIKIVRSTLDLEKRVKEAKAPRPSSRTSSLAERPDTPTDDARPQSRSSLRRRQRSRQGPPNEKEEAGGSVRWSKGWAKASERWRINARLSAKRRKIGIVRVSPSTLEETNDPTEDAVEQQSEAHARQPSCTTSTTAVTSRRPSVDTRPSTVGPSPTFPPPTSSLSPTGPTSDPSSGPPADEHQHNADQPRNVRRIYPDVPAVDDIAVPPGQPRLHPPMIVLSPPPLSIPSELDSPQDNTAVSPPAYRRRGFSLLSSVFTSSHNRPTRTGKEREAGLDEDMDDTTPAEYSGLAVLLDPSDAGPIVSDSPAMRQALRTSIDAASPHPLNQEFDLPMDEDDVDSEGDQRRVEATGHIATDEKDVLERLAVLRSRPEPASGDVIPETVQVTAPALPVSDFEDGLGGNDGDVDNAAPTPVVDQADRGTIPLLPAPPVLTKAHHIPRSTIADPVWPRPAPPAFVSPISQEQLEFSDTKRPREKEGIGDLGWLPHPSVLEQPSAPPLLDEADMAYSILPPSLPSAPPLDDFPPPEGPSAPPDSALEPPSPKLLPPTHPSAPTIDDEDEIEYVSQDDR